jgi:predicted patatin/cPLA2 family phospholipase
MRSSWIIFHFFTLLSLHYLTGVSSRCKVLVLSGGGSYGAFEASVVESLANTPSEDWDVVSGVSAGSINALYISTFNLGKLNTTSFESIWRNIKNEDVLSLELFYNKQSLYATNALEATLNRLFKNRTLKRKVSIGATSLSSLQNTIFTEKEMQLESKIDIQYMMASTAIPIAFPPRVIGSEVFVDGGITGNIELWEGGIDRCDSNEKEIYVDIVLSIPLQVNESHATTITTNPTILDMLSPLIKILMNQVEYADLIRDNHLQECDSAFSDSAFSDSAFSDSAFSDDMNMKHIYLTIYQPDKDIDISYLDFNQGGVLWELGKSNVMNRTFELCF